MTYNVITTKAGPVEVEVQGSGIPILVLHGSPGGIDAAVAMSRFLEPDEFKTICLSRPGYLGTPLNTKKASVDDEADLLAAVLETLQMGRVGVLAWSGGGPVAYRLAFRHPNIVASIVAIAAGSSQLLVPKSSIADRLMRDTTLGGRLVAFLSKKAPDHIIEEALKGEGSLRGEKLSLLVKQAREDPAQRRLILEIVPTANAAGKRQAGWRNDVANFARIDSLDLEQVQCPVLLVQGEADTDVVPEHSRSAHAKLPNSTLIEMVDGTHLCFYAHPEANDIQARARKWFTESMQETNIDQ